MEIFRKIARGWCYLVLGVCILALIFGLYLAIYYVPQLMIGIVLVATLYLADWAFED